MGTGRHGIFGLKPNGRRYQGLVTQRGGVQFERARTKLQRLAKWRTKPSDGDVMEALAMGWDAVAAFLRAKSA